jgi:hypothetical protein
MKGKHLGCYMEEYIWSNGKRKKLAFVGTSSNLFGTA